MRIGIVCPYDLAVDGGVQQLCSELATRLTAAGDDAVLIGPSSDSGALGRTITVRGNRSTVPLTLAPRSISATRRRLAHVDVVHVHEPFVPLVGWAALRTPKPRVATFHADPAPWTRRLYRAGAGLGNSLLADSVLTAASPVAADALPDRWGEVSVIPNAIDVPSYRPEVARHPHRVAFLGRDDPRKGLGVLLEAWPAIRAEVPEAELRVMGRGRPRSLPGVEFLGRVDEGEKRRTLASAAVMVAPNLGGESFGITVAEAMAAGCAVVASDLAAFAAVLDGNGILVPTGDPSYLARQVAGLLADPDRIRSLGRRARESAARFDWPRVLDRYRTAYESAVNR